MQRRLDVVVPDAPHELVRVCSNTFRPRRIREGNTGSSRIPCCCAIDLACNWYEGTGVEFHFERLFPLACALEGHIARAADDEVRCRQSQLAAIWRDGYEDQGMAAPRAFSSAMLAPRSIKVFGQSRAAFSNRGVAASSRLAGAPVRLNRNWSRRLPRGRASPWERLDPSTRHVRLSQVERR